MKDFLKYTFASLLGFVLAGVVFIVLGIVSLVGMFASSDTETTVSDNSVFVLELGGELKERVDDNPLQEIIGDKYAACGLDEILSAIRKAKDNEDIKGIYLEAAPFAASLASLEEIRNALVEFKESGKFLVAYGDMYTQGMYYLASVADRIIVNPKGSISWHGLASQPVFMKDLLAKVGIEMQVVKVGTYKSAVEPFTSTEMSPAYREQVTEYLQSIWGRMLDDVSASRGISVDSLNLLADRSMELEAAEEYVACGLADTLLYKDGVLGYLKQLTDCEPDDRMNTLTLADMKNVRKNVPKDKSGNLIAVYYAFGDIDNPMSGEEGIQSEKVINDLRKLRENESVKAVVLRVNSPGGSAYGSEQIWNEVVRMKEEKPVVVSMGDYAASGGYYISCAADCIVAQPMTLTGSIGIFAQIPNFDGLLTDKLGLHFDLVQTNKHADMGNMTRALTAEERGMLQKYINRGYELFVKRCADGRGMTVEELGKIAEGRVWTGSAAKELGLVDELGGLDKALQIAAEKAGIEHYSVINRPEQEDVFAAFLGSKKERYIEGRVAETLGEYYGSLKLVRSVLKGDRAQARLPYELNIQ